MLKLGKYKTRDGRYAILLCNNAPGRKPLVGYILSDDETDSLSVSWFSSGFRGYYFANATDLIEYVGRVRWEYLTTSIGIKFPRDQ